MLQLSGIGNACVASSITVIIQRSFPAHSALAAALELIGASVGIILSPLVIYYLIEEYGWRWAMRYHGLIGLNIAVMSWLLRTPEDENRDKSTMDKQPSFLERFTDNLRSLREMLRNPHYVLCLISNILTLQMLLVTMVHTPSRMVSMGYTAKWGTYMASLIAGLTLVARLVIIIMISHIECSISFSKCIILDRGGV